MNNKQMHLTSVPKSRPNYLPQFDLSAEHIQASNVFINKVHIYLKLKLIISVLQLSKKYFDAPPVETNEI